MEIPLPDVINMLEEIMTWHKIDEGHGARTAYLAVNIGARLGSGRLNDRWLELLSYGARIHDFGRTGLLHSMVNNSGPLTKAERAAIQSHPQIGYDFLKPAHLPPEITLTVLHHHESWDGSGYPRGLRGEDIPLNARIVKICDVWDSLTSDRPYRRAYPRDIALGIMNEEAKNFDPKIYPVFLSYLKEIYE